MTEAAIIDTSVIIICEKIGIIQLLPRLFFPIECPNAVAVEFGQIPSGIDVVQPAAFSLASFLHADLNLGKGESEAIACAFEKKSLLLIDDLRARKIARDMSIKILGTIGIISRLYKNNQIQNPSGFGMKMREHGYWVSDDLLLKLRDLENGKKKSVL